MFFSIGIDIVDIYRFKQIVDRWGERFIQRILTEQEIQYCRSKTNSIHSMAVRFAAKEAMIKSLPSSDQSGFKWLEMEVINAESGKPAVRTTGFLADKLRDKNILISLSHTDTSAVAVVILQTNLTE
ncbi:holo-ACP synthase [candidate division KSB1 bacterium]|nr:holo-ACP synthase [candidate division KSB1 bacterium]